MTNRAPALAIMGIGTTIIIGLGASGYFGGLRINLTPSYPLGLWRIEPLERPAAVGDLVFICPPDTQTFRQATERGYLRRGLCPGWLSPLTKTVVATSGQHVAIDEAMTIDGALLAASALRPTDAERRDLVAHHGGVVPPGHLFVHSDFKGSYDSRYFGPIPAAGFLGLAHPVLTYARQNWVRSTGLVAAAVVVGAVAWSGNPLTLPMAFAFPAVWALSPSRLVATLVSMGYFLAASRGLPQGVANFYGGSFFAGSGLWIAASLAFVSVHTVLWTPRPGWHCAGRYAVAACSR